MAWSRETFEDTSTVERERILPGRHPPFDATFAISSVSFGLTSCPPGGMFIALLFPLQVNEITLVVVTEPWFSIDAALHALFFAVVAELKPTKCAVRASNRNIYSAENKGHMFQSRYLVTERRNERRTDDELFEQHIIPKNIKASSSSHKSTMNDNQNHRVRQGWTSSRVIAPPGGGGSLTLGMAPPAHKTEPPGKCQCQCHCSPQRDTPFQRNTFFLNSESLSLLSHTWWYTAKENDQPKPSLPQPAVVVAPPVPPPKVVQAQPPQNTTTNNTPAPILPGLGAASQPVSANAFASGANMNGAQVMTGRPTSRVKYGGGTGGPDSGWKLG